MRVGGVEMAVKVKLSVEVVIKAEVEMKVRRGDETWR